jgi:hypothetical protein
LAILANPIASLWFLLVNVLPRPAQLAIDAESGLALDKRQSSQVVAVQKQQVEEEEDQRLTSIGRVLDRVESRPSIGENSAEFPVEVGILRWQAGNDLADGRVFICPVVAPASQDLHAAAAEAGVHCGTRRALIRAASRGCQVPYQRAWRVVV